LRLHKNDFFVIETLLTVYSYQYSESSVVFVMCRQQGNPAQTLAVYREAQFVQERFAAGFNGLWRPSITHIMRLRNPALQRRFDKRRFETGGFMQNEIRRYSGSSAVVHTVWPAAMFIVCRHGSTLPACLRSRRAITDAPYMHAICCTVRACC